MCLLKGNREHLINYIFVDGLDKKFQDYRFSTMIFFCKILSLQLILLRVTGELGPISADTGWDAGYSLDRSPVNVL